MHESEVATEVEGEHAVPAEQQARHVVVGRYDEPPVLSLLPVLQSSSSSLICLPFLSFLPSSPPFLSSPLSLQCPLACCRAASPCAHLEMEARTAMHPTAVRSK